jgi:putative transposase
MTRACERLGISRRRLKYASMQNDDVVVKPMIELTQQHRRAGARQLRRLMKRQGMNLNLKRLRWLCRLHGLLLKQSRRKKRLSVGAGMPRRAEHPNHLWAYDFMEDRTETGRKLRILTIVDEFNRRCIQVEVEDRMKARFVARTLLKLFAVHGIPTFIRSDNGPEFIARFLMNVLNRQGVRARHIDPGSPWQNGKNERFNGTLRDECLKLETFHHCDHARAIVKLFARHYNDERPHSSLATKANWAITPSKFYQQWKKENQKDGFAGGGSSGLSHCAPPAVREDKDGLTEPKASPSELDQPDSRMAIHVGAPVAPQQSRILRVDEASISASTWPGTFPAAEPTTGPKTPNAEIGDMNGVWTEAPSTASGTPLSSCGFCRLCGSADAQLTIVSGTCRR